MRSTQYLKMAIVAGAAALALGRPALALDEVSFGTNWLAEAEHGGFYQAVADGTYEKAGLKVTIVQGGPQAAEPLASPAGPLLPGGEASQEHGGPGLMLRPVRSVEQTSAVVGDPFSELRGLRVAERGQGGAVLLERRRVPLVKRGLELIAQLPLEQHPALLEVPSEVQVLR